jgi:hypothetical protein
LEEHGRHRPAEPTIERLWQQVFVSEDGEQTYRLRGLVRTTGSREIEIGLPGSPNDTRFQATLDGKRMQWIVANRGEPSSVVRLRIDPDAERPQQVLDLTYHLPAEFEGMATWMVILRPPTWISPIAPATRWQIGFGGKGVPISLDRDPKYLQHWRWEYGTYRPQAAWTTATLSRWLVGDVRLSDSETSGSDSELVAAAHPSQPLRFLLVPRAFLWLVCSLFVLVVGAATAILGGKGRAILWCLMLLGTAGLVLLYPQALGVVFTFAQPGFLILLLILVVWAVTHRRSQRESVFLPRGVRPGVASNGESRSVSAIRRMPEMSSTNVPSGS